MNLSRKQQVIGLLLISALLFVSFVVFSYFVHKKIFTSFDFDTTVKLQDRLPHKLDLPFTILSLLGTAEVTTIIWVGLAIFVLLKRWWLTFISMGLFPFSIFLEIFGKVFVYHPAPPLFMYRGLFNFSLSKYYIHTDYSYPSGHVTRTTFIITFLMLVFLARLKNKKIQTLLILSLFGLLILMMLSRVYLAEHWTTDVVGGFLLGSSFGIISGITTFKRKQQTFTQINQLS